MANNSLTKTPRFTICFPALFEPRPAQNGGDPKYSLVAVFPKSTDLTVLKQAASAAAKARWPQGIPRNFRSPFNDGDNANPDWGEVFKNAVYIRLSSKFQPALVDASKGEITNPDDVYSGQECVALVHAFAYDTAGNQGVSFGLDAVQVVADGERIGGFSKQAMIDQFDQLAPADPKVTDLFDKAPAASAQAPAESDPFNF